MKRNLRVLETRHCFAKDRGSVISLGWLQGAHKLDEVRILAQRRELLILERVLHVRVPFLIGLTQIEPAMLSIALAAIHFGNHVMEVGAVTLSGQFDGDAARRGGIED